MLFARKGIAMDFHDADQGTAAVAELFAALNNPRLYETACLEAVKQVMTNAGKDYALLLSAIDPFDSVTTREENTALHICAKRGYTSVIRYLVDNITFPLCDINKKNAKNKTALDIAAAKGHFSIVQHLVKNHAVVTTIEDPSDYNYDRTIRNYLQKSSGAYQQTI